MMITATGNNFGAYTIQLKDYQSDKMVVLNGRFELNPESEEYQRFLQETKEKEAELLTRFGKT